MAARLTSARARGVAARVRSARLAGSSCSWIRVRAPQRHGSLPPARRPAIANGLAVEAVSGVTASVGGDAELVATIPGLLDSAAQHPHDYLHRDHCGDHRQARDGARPL